MKTVSPCRRSAELSRWFLSGALVSAALLCSSSSAQAQSRDDAPSPGPTMPGSLRGAAAIEALGDRLDEVALEHHLDGETLREQLTSDPTLWLTTDDQLVFVDIPADDRFQHDDGPSYSGSIPTSQAFLLHTSPGNDQTIYLDFDGHKSVNNGWGHNIDFPPFNTSGSSATFTTGELQSIIAHWEYIKEDFAPYDVDVTTEEPDATHLQFNGFNDDVYGVRCVFTQATDGFGNGIGGIADLGSFRSLFDKPVFAFNKGDNTGSMTGSHELGHSLNMIHDGLFGQEYHPGTGSGSTSWGPIMGAPFGKTVVHWSVGDYSGSTTTQNDTGFMSSPFAFDMGPTPDTAPDVVGAGKPLSIACPGGSFAAVSGMIQTQADVDVYEFSTSGGPATISANPWNPGPNLDIRLELYDGAGALIAFHDPSNQTNAVISQTLAAGNYSVLIDGVGKPGVYSDYGSQGQYDLAVGAAPGDVFADLGSGLSGTGGIPVATGSGLPCDGNAVAIDLAGARPSSSAWLAMGIGQLNAPFKGGLLVPNITVGGAFLPTPTNGSGAVSISTTWPAGVTPGVPLDFQFWIQDPVGVFGFAASNALELITP
ncbi:MAG: hypothetical protein ACI9EF_002444 [Pseudohongiellaceae bacterium]|jgi:hypothetical protein